MSKSTDEKTEQMRAMAVAGCARKMNPSAFEAYWSAKAPAAASGSARKSWQGRSIQEMLVLLDAESKAGDDSRYDAEACETVKNFFIRPAFIDANERSCTKRIACADTPSYLLARNIKRCNTGKSA